MRLSLAGELVEDISSLVGEVSAGLVDELFALDELLDCEIFGSVIAADDDLVDFRSTIVDVVVIVMDGMRKNAQNI